MGVALFAQPGWQELVLILVIVLLLFGAKKLPDLARSLGKSLSEFKRGREEGAKPDNAETPAKRDDADPDATSGTA
ncbi:MAG: twin-arginine translocase TatA/TatE family subunit [Kiritimatiellae bacterium]|nr:twin-arginine translocase TatA/TatE family subunit [Kiritimatiellia bacterium]